MRDVAHVRDGYPPQTNIARVDGKRAVVMNVLKTGNASTLDIIDGINSKLPLARATMPHGLEARRPERSVGVRARRDRRGRSGKASSPPALTGLMILLFLGSWRSTLIITISIPLSILASVACLAALGETINIMTLGGLALSVGILVDDATVTIENINYHLEQGSDVEQAILDGAHQIALPALVSTLSICIVFVPMFQLAGIAKYLFIPLAEAVVFAMLASYILSRTLIPTLAKYWLKKKEEPKRQKKSGIWRVSRNGSSTDSSACVTATASSSAWRSTRRAVRRRLPARDGRRRAPGISARPAARPRPGFLPERRCRSAQAAFACAHRDAHRGDRDSLRSGGEDASARPSGRARSPPSWTISGLPYSGINSVLLAPPRRSVRAMRTFSSTWRRSTRTLYDYQRELRQRLAASYPSTQFAFLPADIVSQILNFGLPSPLDVQVTGPNVDANREFMQKLLPKLIGIAGAVDLHIQQPYDYPQINVDVDRSKAEFLGLTQQNVASNLLISLSGSFQTTPSFWIDPKTRHAVQRGRANAAISV